MARDSWRQLIRQACIDGFVELRDERAFEHLLKATKYGAAQQSRQFATAAVGRLGAHFEGRTSELTDALVPLLDDPDFRVRVAAANALKALKDSEHLDELDRMAERELDGRGVRAARDAALTLRRGPSTDGEVRNLRDEFEKLRAENAKLQERVEKLEPRRR
jgi:aminopeptidase N